ACVSSVVCSVFGSEAFAIDGKQNAELSYASGVLIRSAGDVFCKCAAYKAAGDQCESYHKKSNPHGPILLH
ncbi:MAG: hypothetical protein J6U75_03300, partial [Clostridia bacterium]|nr:hypothetical protein [Clostridia bacterium]